MAEYIEREKTVELLRSLGNREYRKENGTIQEAIKMISYPEYTPTADVAPVVHAQWIEDGSGIIICPECKRGYNLIAKFTNYCPACGAKMDGGDSDEAD
jgi:hypothetical protein